MNVKELMDVTIYKIDDNKINDKTVFVILWEGHLYICEEMDT